MPGYRRFLVWVLCNSANASILPREEKVVVVLTATLLDASEYGDQDG